MARYIEIEKEQTQQEKAYQHASDRYALERKYNKAKPHQLIEYIINGEKVDTYLYASNNQKLWANIHSTILRYKFKDNEKYNNACHILKTVVRKANTFIDLHDNVKAIDSIVEIYDERVRDVEAKTQ